MKLLFERGIQSYLPEVRAYREYLEKFPGVSVFENASEFQLPPAEADVVWRFPGIDRAQVPGLLIHEYNSLSTAPFAKSKNWFKPLINTVPHFRVFLSERVRSDFSFSDEIPHCLRGMGINREFYRESHVTTGEFALIYFGSINRARKLEEALRAISKNRLGLNILLVGDPSSKIYDEFRNDPNISFSGRVNQSEIPDLANRALAGLNFLPDVYPYNIQPSTKLLEYCALGLPVVTTSYDWVRQFEHDRGAEFVWLNEGLSELSRSELESRNFMRVDVSDLEWAQLIKRSGVFESVLSIAGN